MPVNVWPGVTLPYKQEDKMEKSQETNITLEHLNKGMNAIIEKIEDLQEIYPRYDGLHKEHYDNHDQLKKEMQLIVQGQDTQCVQIDKIERKLEILENILGVIHYPNGTFSMSTPEKETSKDAISKATSMDTRPYYDRIAELAGDMHKARGEGMRDVNAVAIGVSTCGGGAAGGGPCTIGGLTFNQALEHMKCGRRVRREAWPNADYWINASTLSIENCKDCGASENIDWNDFIANDWKVELSK